MVPPCLGCGCAIRAAPFGAAGARNRASSGPVTLLAAFFIVIANLVVDLLYAVVDPRVRTQ